jgi:hypothetical protein
MKTKIKSSLRNVVLKHTQDDILDKDETMDNVQERNICTNLPSSQTFRSYLQKVVWLNIIYYSFQFKNVSME